MLAALLIPVSVESFGEPRSNPVAEQKETETEQPEQEPKPLPATPASVVQEKAREVTTKEEERPQEDEYYRKANLDAQVRMAEASQDLVKLTMQQLRARIFEMVLLVGAVGAAVWAAMSATKAAAAAQASVEVTSRMAERQLRAYVNVETAMISWKENTLFVEISFRNGGQTPAYDVATFAKTAIAEEKKFLTPSIDEIPPLGDWGPGEKFTITTGLTSVTIDDWHNICAKKQPFFVWGVVRYFDAFRREQRHTNFRFKMQDGLVGHIDRTKPTLCPEGNRSN